MITLGLSRLGNAVFVNTPGGPIVEKHSATQRYAGLGEPKREGLLLAPASRY